jgi:fermentation-respiration switch protein FrsA (DUF1100 family)
MNFRELSKICFGSGAGYVIKRQILTERHSNMIDLHKIDYTALDRPDIVMSLFHPRSAWGASAPHLTVQDVRIPVEKNITVGAQVHMAGQANPVILFFHGNGEIVEDYLDLAMVYLQLGLNFFPVDYRGYGHSTGSPTVTTMMRDAHVIFAYVKSWMKDQGFTGPLIVMGRSLGSASALELASCYAEKIDGLIIESGFAHTRSILRILGINMDALGIREEDGFRNLDKMRTFGKPALVIHAERDHILPFSDGEALFESCPAADKTFLGIPRANHNDIFIVGLKEYMRAVKGLSERVSSKKVIP